MAGFDNIPSSDPKTINTIKEYVAPIFMGIVGIFLWRDISEMREDIKLLLSKQSADNIRLNDVENDVEDLKQVVYEKKEVNNKSLSFHLQPVKKEEETTIP